MRTSLTKLNVTVPILNPTISPDNSLCVFSSFFLRGRGRVHGTLSTFKEGRLLPFLSEDVGYWC